MIRATNVKKLDKERDNRIEVLFSRYGYRYRIWLVFTVGLGSISTILASTSINVAIPHIMGAFGIDQNQAQWLSTGYLASSTITMLITAWLINRFGEKLTFFGCMLLFIFSSFLGAFCQSFETLILARVLQGIASGNFIPLAMILLRKTFPVERQGLAMGVWSTFIILAPALGPVFGGIMVDSFNWRASFYVALPMAFLSFPFCYLFLPEKDNKSPNKPLDVPSLILLSTTIFLLLLGLTEGPNEGWRSNYILTCFFAILCSGVLLIYRMTRCSEPLLNLALFMNKDFAISQIFALVSGAAIFAVFYALPLFLQSVQGMNATNSGLVLLPAGLIMAVIMPFTGYVSDRTHSGLLIVLGVFLIAYSNYLLASANRLTDILYLIAWFITGRVGLSFLLPASSISALVSTPAHYMAQAAGVTNFMRQLGGALGVNLTAIYLERRTAIHLELFSASQGADNFVTQEFVHQVTGSLISAGIDASQQVPTAIWVLGRAVYLEALTMGFQDVFSISAILFGVTAIPACFISTKQLRNH